MIYLGDHLAGAVGNKVGRSGDLDQRGFYFPDLQGMIKLFRFGNRGTEIVAANHNERRGFYISNE